MEWGTKRNTQAFPGDVHKLMVLKKYVFHPASESETANEVLWTLGTTRQVLYYTQNASRHRLHSPPNLHTYIIYIVANLVPSSHRVWAHQAQPNNLSPAHLLMTSPDIAGQDGVQVRLVPANQSLRLPKHFLHRQWAPCGRLTNHHFRLSCDLAI